MRQARSKSTSQGHAKVNLALERKGCEPPAHVNRAGWRRSPDREATESHPAPHHSPRLRAWKCARAPGTASERWTP
eukprot:9135460-Pyramimonas_sp.AAC.1